MPLQAELCVTLKGSPEAHQTFFANFEAYAHAHPAMRRVVVLAAGDGLYKGHYKVFEFLWLWGCCPAWPRYTVHVLAYPGGRVRYYARLAPFMALRLDINLALVGNSQTRISEQICIYGPAPLARVFLGILKKEHAKLFSIMDAWPPAALGA